MKKPPEMVGKNFVEAKTGQAAAPLSTGSCSCKPSLSVLRRLKTRCSSSMGSYRLNDLAYYVHSEIPVDSLRPLQRWDASGHRRIVLPFNS